ncbi:MAG: hypothetical protein ACR2OF_03495 [Hyphomicrobium sp.]
MSDASQPEPSPAPASVHLLAEHLDAVLAAGEDLNKVRYVWFGPLPREPEDIAKNCAGQRDAVERIRTLELALLSRILTGREWADELAANDDSFSAIAQLYVSTTSIFIDAVEECADSTAVDFDTGDGLTAYMRSRGLIEADAPALDDASPIKVDDEFLVARRLRLGALLDLVSAFLDALEVEYNLFGDSESSSEPASTDQPAAVPAQ